MKNLKTVLLLITFFTFNLEAQEKAKQDDLTKNLVSKGNIYFGFNTNLAMGFARPENRLISHTILSPKVGYFIANRLSFDMAYKLSTWTSQFGKPNILHGAEFNVNYFLYAKRNTLVYVKGGLSAGIYGQGSLLPSPFYLQHMFGAGISWRFPKNPNFGINVEATHYTGTGPMNQFRRLPNLTVGFSFFIQRKKPKINKKTDLLGNL